MSFSSFGPLVPTGARAAAPDFRPFGEEPAPVHGVAEPRPASAALPGPSDEVRQAFQAGYDLGREETRSQLESVAESFVKSLEELAAFRARLRERYERELLELALGVARKVVQQELAERPAIWLGMIRAAVHRAVDRERIAVRVPPQLTAFLQQALPELRASLTEVKEIELLEDPSLPGTGCVIESRFGDIDVGLETQIENSRRALLRSED